MENSSKLLVRQAIHGDLDRCHEIEAACYGSEGATRARISRRIMLYSQGFLVATVDDTIAGFVNSGATDREDISDEQLKDLVGHEELGRHAVIFSLAVHPVYRGQGISRHLMSTFIERARQMGKQSILLLCTEEMFRYYMYLGFADRGESLSTHGGMNWREMALALKTQT